MNDAFIILEFDKILGFTAALAQSEPGRAAVLSTAPKKNAKLASEAMREVSDAAAIVGALGSPPLPSMPDMERLIALAEAGGMLTPAELESVGAFLTAVRRVAGYLDRASRTFPSSQVALCGASLYELAELRELIAMSVRSGAVDDGASARLRELRRKLDAADSAIRAKLEQMLRARKEIFSDGFIAARAGRLTLPVKREFRSQLQGAEIDRSATGATVFIEPSGAAKARAERELILCDEENEVRRILYELSGFVASSARELRLDIECLTSLDTLFARAKYALDTGSVSVPFTSDGRLVLRGARHPLLPRDKAVPLDIDLGGDGGTPGIVITGPNTGGKTVALKTAGLLTLMANCGLPIPAQNGSAVPMRGEILCDIGDGQSISENLSTFSSHIRNIVSILSRVGPTSLVILDELGSGTDPAEGMGLAVAVLERLAESGCLVLATTHYPELKEYAAASPHYRNARMAFDLASLRPLYRLELGEAGESCALYIAGRLGMDERLIKRAAEVSAGARTAPSAAAPRSEVSPETREVKLVDLSTRPLPGSKFKTGDSVIVYPERATGIVFLEADESGELVVQVKGKKRRVNHKRLKLRVAASELYPDNYDMSIVFDDAETRRNRHELDRGKRDAVIEYKKEDY